MKLDEAVNLLIDIPTIDGLIMRPEAYDKACGTAVKSMVAWNKVKKDLTMACAKLSADKEHPDCLVGLEMAIEIVNKHIAEVENE